MSHDCERCPVVADARAEIRELRRVRLARQLESVATSGCCCFDCTALRRALRRALDPRKPLAKARR